MIKTAIKAIVVSLLLISNVSFAQRVGATKMNYDATPVVSGDPLSTRIYKLKNGLMVYISQNKLEPRIQTYVAVRTGSKNDPADATGLAHYLEHMLFKGSDKYGSLDFTKEKKELNLIESLYETYRSTSNENDRKKNLPPNRQRVWCSCKICNCK